MDIKNGTSKSSRWVIRRRVKSKHGDCGKNFKCKKCSRLFTTSGGLSKHLLRCHEKHHVMKSRLRSRQTQTPEACMTRADRDSSDQPIDTIKTSADNLIPAEESEEFCFKTKCLNQRKVCDICLKSFANVQVLKTHMRRHTGERPYFCTLCEKTFTQKNGLIVHMHTHANEQFPCHECGLVFTQLRSLKRHSKYHTGELQMKRSASGQYNEFKVRVCKALSDTGVQEYENVFRCNFCDKDFKTGSQLMVHRRVHTDERPFECRMCQRSFKQKITLLDHESTHLPQKSHKCHQCGSLFKQQRTLRQHKKLQICKKKVKKNRDSKNQKGAEISVPGCQEETNILFSDVAQNAEVSCMQSMKHCIEQNSDDKLELETEMTEESIEIQDKVQVEYITVLDGEQGVPELVSRKSDLDHGAYCTSTETDTSTIPMFVCEYCGKGFKGKRNVIQHQKTHTDERPFVCGICFKGFKIKATLVEHVEIHTEGKPHPCQTCGKHFKTQKCLQNHVGRNICTGIRPYVCRGCSKAFMYDRYLEKHRCLGSVPKTFECEECGRKFTRHNLLTEHKRVHTGERPFECEDCCKTFAKRDLWRRHRLTHKDKRFECQECGKRFAQKSTMQVHMSVHSKERKHVCDVCNKSFKLASSLRNHLKAMHTKNSKAETKPSAYLCSYCGKVFRHLGWMLKHLCEATGVKRFQCSMCSKKFDKKQQLEVHSRTHTGIRPYKCKECEKCFTQVSSLKDHMVTHTGEKNYKCDLCHCAFTRKNSLQRHKLIIHEGVEPFICSKCGLTFKYKKSYNAHANVCAVVKVNERSNTVQTETVQDVVTEDRKMVNAPDFEQQVLDNILGNIERAMNGAGIEIRPDVQYQIVVGENASEVTVHVTGDAQ